MKFAIVVLLLATVVGVYSQGGALGQVAKGAGGKGAPKNLSQKDIVEIFAVLTKVLGPKLAGLVTKLLVSLANNVLRGVPIQSLLHGVTQLVTKLLKPGGILTKLLAGGNKDAFSKSPKQANGKPKNLTPADQEKLEEILSRTVGPFTSKYLVKTVATLVNGLLGKLPLNQLLHGVSRLVKGLLKPKGLLGKLLGRKGLGGPISRLLGAHGDIL